MNYKLQLYLLQHDRQLYDDLLPYWTVDNRSSILKSVPMELLDRLRAVLRVVKPDNRTNYRGVAVPQKWNTVYRGPRRHPNTAMTLKDDAHSFDIYLRG